MSDSMPIQWREPERFAIGDTLKFQRNLPGYKPSDGWSLSYSLIAQTDLSGQQVATFSSAPDSSNTYHTVDVLNFAQGQVAGDFILVGEAICSPTGTYPNEKHQIYYSLLKLQDDLADGQVSGPITTHSQRMITLLEAKLERLEAYDITESDVNRTRFVMEERVKVKQRLMEYKELRRNEIKIENQRNGRDGGEQQFPVFRII